MLLLLLRAYCFSEEGEFLGLQQQFTESGSGLDGTVSKLLHFAQHPAGTKQVFIEFEDWLVRGMPKKDWYTPTYYHFTTIYPEKKLVDAFTLAPVDRDFGAWVAAGGLRYRFISKATLLYSVGKHEAKSEDGGGSAKR